MGITDQSVQQMRQIAYVMSMTVAASARIEGMKAANAERVDHGHAQAYNEDAFEQVILEFGLHHNAVLTSLSI